MAELNNFEINKQTLGFENAETEKFANEFEEWRATFDFKKNPNQLSEVEWGNLKDIEPKELSRESRIVFEDIFLNGGKILESESAIDKYLGESTSERSEMLLRHWISHALYFNKNILKRVLEIDQGGVA